MVTEEAAGGAMPNIPCRYQKRSNTKTLMTAFLLVAYISPLGHSAELRQYSRHKPETISFRILAVGEPIARSSFSPSRDAMLVTLHSRETDSTAAKIVFRYMGYEDSFPEELIDYNWVHTFKALRDRSCDETWRSFSTTMKTGQHDTIVVAESVRYVATKDIAVPLSDDVLPCYVIQAAGYKGSKRISQNQIELPKISSAR
jgi:hypothetical protein